MAAALPSLSNNLLLESNAATIADHSHIWNNSHLAGPDSVHFDLFKRRLEINGVVDSDGTFRFKKRAVTASRKFPKGCGRCVHRVAPTSVHVQQQDSLPVGPLSSVSLTKSSNSFCSPQKLQTSKYSAARKFPFGCGRNARHLTVEEKGMFLSSLRRKGGHDLKFLQATTKAAEHQNEQEKVGKDHAIDRASITLASQSISQTEAKSDTKLTDKKISEGEKDIADQSTMSRIKEAATPESASVEGTKEDTLKKRLIMGPETSSTQKAKCLKLSTEPAKINSQGHEDDKKDPADLDFFKGKSIVLALMAPQCCPRIKGRRAAKR